MNICVFCSSASNLDSCYVKAAQKLGQTMAQRGHTLVFGGYDMGLMGEVANAVVSAGGKAIGITTEGLTAKGRRIVSGIHEQQVENLSQRKDTMVSLSEAFITLPGGIGTLDEFFSVISQAKVGEIKGRSALLNVEGYFDPLVQMLNESCSKGLNSTDWHEYGNVFSDCDALLNWLEER